MNIDQTVLETIKQVLSERGKSESFTKAFIKWIEEESEREQNDNDRFQRIDVLKDLLDENRG